LLHEASHFHSSPVEDRSFLEETTTTPNVIPIEKPQIEALASEVQPTLPENARTSAEVARGPRRSGSDPSAKTIKLRLRKKRSERQKNAPEKQTAVRESNTAEYDDELGKGLIVYLDWPRPSTDFGLLNYRALESWISVRVSLQYHPILCLSSISCLHHA